MRQHIRKLSVDEIEWIPTGTPGVMEKILNEDQVTGARTLMLKSLPRPSDQIIDRRPQVHPVDEEFFCLSGRFTLEGDVWFQFGTYVYYPPNLVHGYAVDVPDGYEIYLRNSGSLSTQRVESPAEDKLHFVNHDGTSDDHVIIRNTNSALKTIRDVPTPTATIFRESSDGHDGALLLTLPSQARITAPEHGYDGFTEVFVLSGRVELTGQAILSSRDYAFVPPGFRVDLVGLEAVSCLIVNYSGHEIPNHFNKVAPKHLDFDH